jgi:hypothetical protein
MNERSRASESSHFLDSFESSQALAPALAFVVTLLSSVLMVVCYGPPLPRIQDEYSYLLGADTFASGRLTNPVHPLARSFETFHVLSHPSYASKYLPAQALLLAFGQVVFKHAYVGVWIGSALAAAAVTWMASAVVSPRATLAAAALASTIFGASYWSYSYWGGGVSALGGALAGGGVLHWCASRKARFAIVAGFGTVILGLSRPFEGALVCACYGAILLWRGPRSRELVTRFLIPWITVVAIGVAFLLRYNLAVTGHAFTLPYMLYEAAHGPMPIFVWGHPRLTPAVDIPPFVDYVRGNLERYTRATDTATMVPAALERLRDYLMVIGVLPASFAALMIPLDADRMRRRETLIFTGCLAFCLMAMLLSVWSYPHYSAPVTGLFVIIVVRGLEVVVAQARHGRVIVVLLLVATIVHGAFGARTMLERYATGAHHDRAQIERDLTAQGGAHVILVTYREPYDFYQAWVYNRADIDASNVVWANALDPEADAAVLAYYANRTKWRLSVWKGGHELVPVR